MARVKFTAGRVADWRCRDGVGQAFLWDATTPGLALRATAGGAKTYVFQGRYQGQTVRIKIGTPDAWTIPQAQERARELQRHIDSGRDPREVIAEVVEADTLKRQATRASETTVAQAWEAYLSDRKEQWGDRHYADHVSAARAGGEKAKRGVKGGGTTKPGPLHSLMSTRLRELDAATVEGWAAKESKTRPTQGRLGLRLLKAFLAWCEEHREFGAAVDGNAAKSRRARETLGSPKPKNDVLLREQLKSWFTAVQAIRNPVHAAYLQALLLCGCRPGEMLELRWSDVDLQWHSLTIRDKVEGARTIPLTPYVEHLLRTVPRVPNCDWVFASARLVIPSDGKPAHWVNASASGRIAHPTEVHARAAEAAGVAGLTLHGLRRSFASLTEWLEVPAGVVAQIQGHRPSATAEKHYKRRPLDLLRVHHERIEAWILEHAGVKFVREGGPSLQVLPAPGARA